MIFKSSGYINESSIKGLRASKSAPHEFKNICIAVRNDAANRIGSDKSRLSIDGSDTINYSENKGIKRGKYTFSIPVSLSDTGGYDNKGRQAANAIKDSLIAYKFRPISPNAPLLNDKDNKLTFKEILVRMPKNSEFIYVAYTYAKEMQYVLNVYGVIICIDDTEHNRELLGF